MLPNFSPGGEGYIRVVPANSTLFQQAGSLPHGGPPAKWASSSMTRRTGKSKAPRGEGPITEIVVLITASSQEEASKIGRALVEAELAACANVLPNIRSIFRWQGQVTEEQESLLLVKTRSGLFNDLASRVKAMHSYKVPEIIALSIGRGWAEYLSWIRDVTKKPQK